MSFVVSSDAEKPGLRGIKPSKPKLAHSWVWALLAVKEKQLFGGYLDLKPTADGVPSTLSSFRLWAQMD